MLIKEDVMGPNFECSLILWRGNKGHTIGNGYTCTDEMVLRVYVTDHYRWGSEDSQRNLRSDN